MSPPSPLPSHSNNDFSRVQCKLPNPCTIFTKVQVASKRGLLAVLSLLEPKYDKSIRLIGVGRLPGQHHLLGKLNYNDMFICQ